MDTREFSWDIILIIILVISALMLTSRLWTDPVLITGAVLMMISLGGLFLLIHRKIVRLEREVLQRERMARSSLEEISAKMVQKYDSTIAHFDGVVESLGKKIYR
jgi:hypothetical protein